MVTIKKVGRLLPRDNVDFFRENKDLFKKLKAGESIEVPDDLATWLPGVKVIIESTGEEIPGIMEETVEEKPVEDEDKLNFKDEAVVEIKSGLDRRSKSKSKDKDKDKYK